jgi:Zn-dependent protease
MVGKKPVSKFRSIYVNLAMLIITFLAMMFAGILDWSSYADIPDNQMFSLDNILTGIVVFTLPLIAILGVHELGHYFMARRRNVAASLPFFIPSIPPLGTFGAFISLRDPIPNKKSLLEIGVAGPLAGMAVALPVAILGLMLTNMEARPVPEDIGTGGLVQISFPLIYLGLEQLVPLEGDYLLHPTAFAAWVGFLVTALNLLPAGQLDGGHIARALLGKNAKYASYVTIAALVALSFFFWSWLIFAILILFLGARHPPPLNDISKLGTKRMLIGAFAFVILVIAFVPVPMTPVASDCSFETTALDSSNRTIAPGEDAQFMFLVENTGNTQDLITFEEESSPAGWDVLFREANGSYEESYEMTLNVSRETVLEVLVASAAATTPGNFTVTIRASSTCDFDEHEETLVLGFVVTLPTVDISVADDSIETSSGSSATFEVELGNSGDAPVNLTLTVEQLPAYLTARLFTGASPDANSSDTLAVVVDADDNLTIYIEVLVWPSTEPGEWDIPVSVYYQEILLGTETLTLVVV